MRLYIYIIDNDKMWFVLNLGFATETHMYKYRLQSIDV